MEILRKENDYFNELVGRTYNQRTLHLVNSFYKDRFGKFSNKSLNKFSLVTCLEKAKKNQEILSIGGSSLLRNKKTNEVITNLILDNFGLWLAGFFGRTSQNAILKDVTNVARTINVVGTGNPLHNSQAGMGLLIRLGSNVTAPARGDVEIGTSLGSAPESGDLTTNQGAYTAGNTVVYQADANPTGGSGSVTEIMSKWNWIDAGSVSRFFAITHDLISPTVNYTAGKLLRGSYTWQI